VWLWSRTPLWFAIPATCLIWWVLANLGVAWSRRWPGAWKYQDQVFLIRGWQFQIWLGSHVLAYCCPTFLAFYLLYWGCRGFVYLFSPDGCSRSSRAS